MTEVCVEILPDNALPAPYAKAGAYTDCYIIDIPQQVELSAYIEAFYTTPLFKVEKAILSALIRRSSTDKEANHLASGDSKQFSIWTVENRLYNQILLCDVTNKTRSWLMVNPLEVDQTPITRLYFGSVVVPKAVSKNGHASFGVLFHLLSTFHRLYSQALLKSTFTNLVRKNTRV